MRYQLDYRIYRRNFRKPVRFGDLMVHERMGMIVRLSDEHGRTGFGEIAPLESFGSESVEKAEMWLKSFHGMIADQSIESIDLQEYPCTRYALKTAIDQLEGGRFVSAQKRVEAIVPAKLVQNDEHHFLNATSNIIGSPNVFKLKIGDELNDQDFEMDAVERVIRLCAERGLRVRLDANEQLSFDQSRRWLDLLGNYPDTVEFLEQPMDRCLLSELSDLQQEFPTPIALDESLVILQSQISLGEMNTFLFVLKPSIGDLEFVEKFNVPQDRVILSSVFETAIGFSKLLELPYFEWTPGLDTQDVFEDAMIYQREPAGFRSGVVDEEKIWNLLS